MIDKSLIISRDRSRTFPVSWIVAIVYLAAIAIAEALTTLIAPLAGMIFHGLIFITLLIQAALSINTRKYRFLVVLALAPLIRLLSLTLPLIQFQSIYWYVVIGVPLYIAAFFCARITGLSGTRIGLRLSWRAIPTQLLIGLSGILVGYIEYLILRPEPLVVELGWGLILLSALILLVFTGLLEEIIFRGMMQTSAFLYLGRLGILYVAVLFAILHFGYRSLVDVVFVFIVAIVFGILVHRTGSLAGVSLSHGLTNISLYLIFPFLLASPIIKDSSPTNSNPPEDLAPNTAVQVIFTPVPSQPLSVEHSVIPKTGLTIEDEEMNVTLESILIPTEGTSIICSLPPTWVEYTIQSGDTMSALSDRYGVDISMLLFINCLESAGDIIIGQQLFVPFEYLPSPTIYPSQSPLPKIGLTPTQKPPKFPRGNPTLTQKPSAMPTPTKRPIATETPFPTPTSAPTLAVPTEEYPPQPTHSPTPDE